MATVSSANIKTPHFIDDRHAIYVGWVMGIALKNGLEFRPVLDGQHNYTDRISMEVGPARITVVVPYPPDEWQLEDT